MIRRGRRSSYINVEDDMEEEEEEDDDDSREEKRLRETVEMSFTSGSPSFSSPKLSSSSKVEEKQMDSCCIVL